MLRPVLRVARGGRREGDRRRAAAAAIRDARLRRAPPRSRSRPSSTRENLKRPESDVPDVLAPGLTAVFCGINPGRVSAAANAHFANPRNDFWRLLHAAGFTPRLFDPSEQFELLPARPRRHECRLPDDARLGRPPPQRLRGLGRAPGAARPGAAPARDRVRRQGGLPRRVRRAAGARRARAPPRRDGALRASLDVAGKRRRALGGAAALVSGLLRRGLGEGRRARRPSRCRSARARSDELKPRCSRTTRDPGPRERTSPRPRAGGSRRSATRAGTGSAARARAPGPSPARPGRSPRRRGRRPRARRRRRSPLSPP